MRKTILVGGPGAIEWAISEAERQSRETETLIERQRLRSHADALRAVRAKMGWHPTALAHGTATATHEEDGARK